MKLNKDKFETKNEKKKLQKGIIKTIDVKRMADEKIRIEKKNEIK